MGRRAARASPGRLWRRIRLSIARISPRGILRRLRRLRATPHAVASGFAAGAAASCTPLFGLHFLLSFAIAWVMRGNMVAAAIGTAVGNPITFPIFVSAGNRLGAWMTGRDAINGEAGIMEILREAWWVTLIGSIPIGLCIFLIVYMLLRSSLESFSARHARRTERDGSP